jgi:hypothetical protein
MNYESLAKTPNQDIDKEAIYQFLVENNTIDNWKTFTQELEKIQKAQSLWFDVNDKLKDENGENISLFGKFLDHPDLSINLLGLFFEESSAKEALFLKITEAQGINKKINEHETIIEHIVNNIKETHQMSDYNQLSIYGTIASYYNKKLFSNNYTTEYKKNIDYGNLVYHTYAEYENKLLNTLLNEPSITHPKAKEPLQALLTKIENSNLDEAIELVYNHFNNPPDEINNLQNGSDRSYLVFLMPFMLVAKKAKNTDDKKKIAITIARSKGYTEDLKNFCIDYLSNTHCVKDMHINTLATNSPLFTRNINNASFNLTSVLVLFNDIFVCKNEYVKNNILNEKTRLEAMLNVVSDNNQQLIKSVQETKEVKKVKI